MSLPLKKQTPSRNVHYAGVFITGLIFAALPWFDLVLVEFFGLYRIEVFSIDKSVLLLLRDAACIYLFITLIITMLSFAASFFISGYISEKRSTSSLKLSMITFIGFVTPVSILQFTNMLLFKDSPFWVFIPINIISGCFLLLFGLLIFFAIFRDKEFREKSLKLITLLGILSGFGLILLIINLSPDDIRYRIVNTLITVSILSAQLSLLVRNLWSWENNSLLKWLCRRTSFSLLLIAVPAIILFGRELFFSIDLSGNQNVTKIGNKPNVIVFLVDTVRADHCSMYGYSKNTMKNIPENMGPGATLFTRATSPASNTIPSVRSLFTSLPSSYWGLEKFASKPLPEDAETMADLFLKSGYKTAIFSASELIRGYGFEKGFQNVLVWSGYAACRSIALTLLGHGDYMQILNLVRRLKAHYPKGEILLDQAMKWIKRNRHEPFFVYIHSVDPHWPYYDQGCGMVPEEYKKYDDRLIYTELLNLNVNPKNQQQIDLLRKRPEFINLESRYDDELCYTDKIISRFIQNLKESGVWKNTMFVLIADHGEEFFDHNLFSHGQDVWEELTHVPMMIKWPQNKDYKSVPERINARVGLVDLLPTFIDIAGLVKPHRAMIGKSICPLLKNPRPAHPRSQFSETVSPLMGNYLFAYLEGNLKVRLEIYQMDPPKAIAAVFDLKDDPGEKKMIPKNDPRVNDIILRTGKCFQKIHDMRSAKVTSKSVKSKRSSEDDTEMDERVKQLKALGYVQ